ncbi:MetQ/NlpA family ABC transporter substrate-binding protein [Millisia brevis]|uniref:MetQ/NlpA family ABC transporter substrate-binding protein n=1 Tax=Millisia brevis TaxID=264148 RepID=UPI00082BBF2A|nr:MetQ/NlpA family ABC transporter substrate-binding protein [Millisia brevis]
MSTPSPEQPLIEAPKSRLPLIIGAIVAVLAVIGAVVLFVNRGGSDQTSAGGESLTTVRLGTVGASDPYWETFREEARNQGIDLQVVDFSDYAQPNPALSEGEIDINQFQHIIYLADYNVKNNDTLVPIGSTAIYPLGLYSTQFDSVEAIPDGSTVVVPDDDTNQARGLLILQSAGLVTLSDGGTPFSTLADIDTANSRVQVQALKADLTPTSLADVAAAIINNDFVENAGLSFDQAIAQDDPSDPKAFPYVNIFAVRADDVDNETYRKLVEIYQSTPAILDGVDAVSGGVAEFVQVPVADLQQSLTDTENQIRSGE